MPEGTKQPSARGGDDRHKFSGQWLTIGQRMPCHAFTQGGVLLLARGEIVSTPFQLDRLLYPDVIFSNAPPPRLIPAIRERQAALGLREYGPDEKDPPPEAEGKHVAVADEIPPHEAEVTAPAVPFVQEVGAARELYQETTGHVVELLDQVRAGRQVDLQETTSSVKRVLESLCRNERAFVSLLRLKDFDKYTFTHSINTCVFALLLARHSKLVGLTSHLGVGALLHDIGKTFFPLGLLQSTGSLLQEEWELIRQHPTTGVKLIEHSAGCREEHIKAILEHHERLDGSGYPAQLRGAQISTAGRIVAIADVYDAMTSNRPYRSSISPATAMRWITAHAGRFFDEGLVSTFLAAVGIFPVGSLARLNTGELAVVVRVNPEALLRPIVLVVADSWGDPLRKPKLMNLARPPFLNIREIIGLEDPHGFDIAVEAHLAAVPEEQVTELLREESGSDTNSLDHQMINTLA